MRKKQEKSFLTNEEQIYVQDVQKRFDALNVINSISLFALLSLFIASIGFCIYDMIIYSDFSGYVIPFVQSIVAVVLTLIPYICAKVFKITFPKAIELMYYVFLFLTMYLGILQSLFNLSVAYNKAIHVYSGFALGMFTMFIVRHISKDIKKTNITLLFVFITVFSFALGTGWEICEFLLDLIFDLNMQDYFAVGEPLVGSAALKDTMLDIIANLAGAIISAILCCALAHKNNNFIDYFKCSKIQDNETKKESQIEDIEEIEE